MLAEIKQNEGMDIKLIRQNNTKKLAALFPEQKNFADHIGIKPQNLSRIIGKNAKRGIGNPLARKIEKIFLFPKNWLDQCNTMSKEELENYVKKRNLLANRLPNIDNHANGDDNIIYDENLTLDYLPYIDLESSSQNLTYTKGERMLISADMKEELELTDGKAACVRIVGSYMEAVGSVLKNKTSIVIDLMKTNIENGKVHLIRVNGNKPVIRRVYDELTHYKIACDNPNKLEYPDMVIEKNNSAAIEVLGRAVTAVVPL